MLLNTRGAVLRRTIRFIWARMVEQFLRASKDRRIVPEKLPPDKRFHGTVFATSAK
jgi:hypothetical protein